MSRDPSCQGTKENRSLTADPLRSDSKTNLFEVDDDDEVERQRGCSFESPTSAKTLPDREETNVDGSYVIIESDLDDSRPHVEMKTSDGKYELQHDYFDFDDNAHDRRRVPPFVESIDIKGEKIFEEFYNYS